MILDFDKAAEAAWPESVYIPRAVVAELERQAQQAVQAERDRYVALWRAFLPHLPPNLRADSEAALTRFVEAP